MGATQVAIGLNKQVEGDQDWDNALNDGIDAANARLTLSGSGVPGGNVAGHWVGQKYVQILGPQTIRAWYCTVATGIAATSTWRSDPVHVDPINAPGQPYWIGSNGINYPFTLGSLIEAASYGVATDIPFQMLNTPTATITISGIGSHRLLVLASVQVQGADRYVGIKYEFPLGGGGYGVLGLTGLPVRVPDNRGTLVVASLTPPNPGNYNFRLFSDNNAGLQQATIMVIGIGT